MKLTIEQKKELNDIFKKIARENDSEARKELFFGKKNIAAIRLWFENFPLVDLSKDEVDEIIKRYNDWFVFKVLINTGKNISTEQAKKMVKKLKNMASHLYIPIINSLTLNNDFRMEIFKRFLKETKNPNLIPNLLQVVNMGNSNAIDDFWKDATRELIDFINANQIGQLYADIWAGEDLHALRFRMSELRLYSAKIYEATEDQRYLPPEVKDIFIF